MKKIPAKEKGVMKKVIPFQKEFNHLSPVDIEELLESLEREGYLNDEGKLFHTHFWGVFINKK